MLVQLFLFQNGERFHLGRRSLGGQRRDQLANGRVSLQWRERCQIGGGLTMLGVEHALELLADLRQPLEDIESVGDVSEIILSVQVGARAS